MRLRLRELRADRGWTQAEVARRAGISTSYYTELEQGKKNLNSRRMQDLARAFGVPPHDLIAGAHVSDLQRELADLHPDDVQIVRDLVRALTSRRGRDDGPE